MSPMDASGSTTDHVTVSLSRSEALVLADALGRWETDGTIAALEPAASRAMFDLAAALEPLVEVAFSDDYDAHLQRARAEVLRS